MSQPITPPADQITFWNGPTGHKWVRRQVQLDAGIQHHGEAAMRAAEIAEGAQVIDVGCGCGTTTLALHNLVGSTGRVSGVDISAPMLAHARERAAAARAKIEFVEADAGVHPFPPEAADHLFSRFGVMFFLDPPAAFRNLRQALRRGGRLSFVCWRERAENPWMMIPVKAVASFLQMPPPSGPGQPGPFGLSPRAMIVDLLGVAGFERIAIEPFDAMMQLGSTVDFQEAVDFAVEIGPTAGPFNDADPATQAKARTALEQALQPHHGDNGVVLPSASWIVTAHRPL